MDTRNPPLALATRRANYVAGLVVSAALSFVVNSAGAQAPGRTSSAPPRTTGASSESTPRWHDLSAPQRQALKPLANSWSALPAAQKRKWIALSRNFDKLPKDEQRKLQARMGEWAALSASERSQARLNFVATEKLSTDDKQAKWLAYQALSDDERHKLAEQAPRRAVPGAAAAVRPGTGQRLTKVPATVDNVAMPRISASPHQIDRNTLLPQVDRRGVQHDGSPRQ